MFSTFFKSQKCRTAAVMATLAAVTSPIAARTVAVSALAVGGVMATIQPAHATLPYGWHDLGDGYQVAVFTADDARAYAGKLTQTTSFQDKVNAIAQILAKFIAWSWAVDTARAIAYNGLVSY